MKVSILFLLTTAMTLSLRVFAGEVGEVKESRSIEQMIYESRLEKLQAESMTETLVESGRFTNDQAERTYRNIASVHEDDLEAIKEVSALKDAPNLANK